MLRGTESRVNVLCLDGGGIRGRSTIKVLKELEKTIHAEFDGDEPKPHLRDHFDLICGTSTGGILAVALACGISLDELEKIYATPKDIFQSPYFGKGFWHKFSFVTGISSIYTQTGLDKKIDSVFDPMEVTTIGDLMDKKRVPDHMRFFVVATDVDELVPQPFLFSNYELQTACVDHDGIDRNGISGIDRIKKISIKQALRATSAAPTYFPPLKMKLPKGNMTKDKVRTFADGGILANNPVELALREATNIWPDRELNCVVSIGTGEPPSGFRPAQIVKDYTGQILTDGMRANYRVIHSLNAFRKYLLVHTKKDHKPNYEDGDVIYFDNPKFIRNDGAGKNGRFENSIVIGQIRKYQKDEEIVSVQVLEDPYPGPQSQEETKTDKHIEKELVQMDIAKIKGRLDEELAPYLFRFNTKDKFRKKRNAKLLDLDCVDKKELRVYDEETEAYLRDDDVKFKLNHLAKRLLLCVPSG